MAQASSRTIRIVSAILNGVESRLSRSHPSAPVIFVGGGCGGMVARRTNANSATARSASAMVIRKLLPLCQRHAPVVDVHQERSRETDHEIDQHRDRNDLDRLSGLVEYRAGKNLHQIGITRSEEHTSELQSLRHL